MQQSFYILGGALEITEIVSTNNELDFFAFFEGF